MRSLLGVIIVAIVASLAAGCREERQSYVPNTHGSATPTMATTDVSTFISDSGYTRYHITTDLWQMFEDAPDPFWLFPTGLYLEQYDEEMQPAASIVCDSARYFSRRRLWKLDGNVVMVNTERDSFLTQQLFWDQTRQTVYSDSFIHIVRQDRIIEGYGFESNQQMTRYTVHRPTGIIPVERPAPDSAADTLSAQRPRRAGAPVRESQRSRDDNDDPNGGFVPAPVKIQRSQPN